jgi:hypothetical protein
MGFLSIIAKPILKVREARRKARIVAAIARAPHIEPPEGVAALNADFFRLQRVRECNAARGRSPLRG